jgi:uncharacterized protein (TIGR03437 family)
LSWKAGVTLLLLPLAGVAQFVPAPNPPFPLAVGHSPASIVAADFNNDSILDLAIANKVDNSVTILLGTAAGGFTRAPDIRVGVSPSAVAAADFDNDGNRDLAVVNQADGSVTILMGNGTGVFQKLATVPTGKNPDFIAIGDFNGDAIPDLAVVNRGGNSIAVLLGIKGGFVPNATAFMPAQGSPFAVGNSPSGAAIGDFNGDMKLDIAVTNELDNTVTVLLANTNGGFTPATASPFLVGSNPSFVVTSDFNGDGFLDLAVANLNSNNVTLLLGNGSGRFSPSPSGLLATGHQPFAIATGDFNGDLITDLAIANYADSNVTVLLGNGAGGFKAGPGSPVAVTGNPTSISGGDFNQDGLPDLAVATTADSVSLLVNASVIVPVMVSAASYQAGPPVALGSLVSIFGTGLAAVTTAAPDFPPCLGGITINITDATGSKLPMQLSYVSPTQINGALPLLAAVGAATFTTSASAACGTPPATAPQRGSLTLAGVAPALFAANGSGKGAAVGRFIADLATGADTQIVSCSADGRTCTPLPLDVSGGNSALVLYGTGIRNRAKLSDVTVSIGGQSLPAYFAAAEPGLPGVDRVNLALPPTLAHTGIVNVTVSIAGTTSSAVTLNLQ